MTRIIKGLLALCALAAITVGTPWLLLQIATTPGFIPANLSLEALFLRPDDGRVFLLLLWAVGWLLWAWLSILVVVELIAALRGVRAPQLPAASLPQAWIRALVMAALALIIATPGMANAEPATPDTQPAPTPAATLTTSMTNPDLEQQPSSPVDDVEQPSSNIIVERGDTLWDLADEHLGDPAQWPEIYEANRGKPQPGGVALDDPDMIDIGWNLTIPASDDNPTAAPGKTPAPTPQANETPTPPAIVETPAAHEAPASPEATPATETTAPQPQSAQTPAEQVTDSVDENQIEEQDWMVAGLLGSGAILGVGVAATLYRRRREQFRIRRPGRIIAIAPPELAPIEQSAQLASGLTSRHVLRLDQVLRRLRASDTSVAAVEAVAMSRTGEILVRTPDRLPSPWIPVDDGWLLPEHIPAEDLPAHPADTPSTYPLLVSIGADAADRIWLINLEAAGILTISGDQVMTEDWLRYIAAELAVNPWSEAVRVACDGPTSCVTPMAPQRLDATVEEITTIASTNLTRSNDLHLDARQGHLEQAGEEAWTAAAAVITDHTSCTPVAELIHTNPGRTNTAVVTVTEQGRLQISADGRITGLGLTLSAVGLTEDEAAGCAALLAATDDQDHTEVIPLDEFTDTTGQILTDHHQPRDSQDENLTESILPGPDDDYDDDTETLDLLAPRVTTGLAHHLIDRDPALDADVEHWHAQHAPKPRLSLLGPVKARVLGPAIPKQRAYYTEALAYLCLHPNGVTSEDFAAAFAISVQRSRTVISNLRRWVGNRGDGTPFIPDARSHTKAQEQGIGLYIAEDILTDIDLFTRLRTRAHARGSDGISDLVAALHLISGEPFSDLRPAGWHWLATGDRIDHHMTAAIGDVAHTLVTHFRKHGDLEQALWAAEIHITADPSSEIARLDVAGIHADADDTIRGRRALADALGDEAELDLTERGQRIARQRGWLAAG